MLGPVALSREDPASGHDHRHAQGRRLSSWTCSTIRAAPAVCHGQSLPAGAGRAGAASARGAVRLRAFQPRPQRQQERLSVARASGSPGTATSAWSSTRCNWARSPAIHHGTYREGRWWWHSRGYTPAGVECLNGIRGIDYLISRPDVDPERIAVTGISGGGRGDVLDRRGRRTGQGRRARQRHGRPGVLRPQPRHQRPLRLHVPLQHVPVALDPHRRPGRAAAAAVRQQRPGRDLPHGCQRARHQRLERLYSLYGAGDSWTAS